MAHLISAALRWGTRILRLYGTWAGWPLRQRDPADPTEVLAGTTTWYDYDGDEIYGDYEVGVEDQEVTTTQNGVTEAGIGQVDYNGSGMSYFHSDHIGSTRLLTDSQHTIEDSYIYTAFGEKIRADGTIGTSYRYAGSSGYQNDSAFHSPGSAFDGMHVGHRYYSPAIGRFLQRDAIGISGGLNVYVYVLNLPTKGVDPTGRGFWDGDNWFHDWFARKFWMNPLNPAKNRLPVMGDGEAIAWVCVYTAIGTAGIYYGGGPALRSFLRRPYGLEPGPPRNPGRPYYPKPSDDHVPPFYYHPPDDDWEDPNEL